MIKRAGITVLLLVLSLAGATQLVAHRLSYADALGRPWVSVGAVKLYAPWRVWGWHRRFGHTHRRVFDAAMFVPCAVLAAVAAVRLHRYPTVKEMGKGCWGTVKDLRRAGLLTGRGLVLGRVGRRLLMYDGPGHLLVVGGSRLGKSIGIVIPSLLGSDTNRSVVVLDPKGELWQRTAGFRSRFSHSVFFNATRQDSVKWNPLLEVRPGCEVRDAQNIAGVLADPGAERQNQIDNIWDISATQLLTALILHVLYTADDGAKHLGAVRDLLLDFDTTCVEMLTTPHRLDPATGRPQVHPEVALVARGLLTAPDRFRGSVVATAQSYLTLFADPLVRNNVSRSQITVGDLMCNRSPVSLYIQTPPSDADRLRPLTRLMLNQIARGLMEHEKRDALNRPKRHGLLLLLEEFSSLGRLPFFEQQLRQMGSFGLQVMMVTQSFSDIMQHYGSHQSLIDNCVVTVAFGSNDTATQSRLSQMVGASVEFREGYSQPRAPSSLHRQTLNLHEQVRPLLEPGQVRQLSADQQLVLVVGHRPFRTQKIRYFRISFFKKRVVSPPDQCKGADVPRANIDNPWLGQRAKGPRIPLEEPAVVSNEDTEPEDLSLDELGGIEEEPRIDDRFAI